MARMVSAKSLVLFLAAFPFLVPSAVADLLPMELTGVNGASAGGVYVGAYYGTVNGAEPVSLFCDDYVHDSWIGQQWIATPHSFADLSQTRYGQGAGALGKYREIAWLILEFDKTPPSQWGGIHFALWSIFNPLPILDTLESEFWLAQAAAAADDTSLDDRFVIYTPVGQRDSQEFLAVVPTPEPESVFLLVALILLLIPLLRRNSAA